MNHYKNPAAKKPVRLLVIITRLELGGAQQVVLNTVRHLSRSRYELYLIAGKGGLLDQEARTLPQTKVYLWKSFRHPLHPFWDLITFLRLIFFMRKNHIQIVHTHSSKAGLLGRLAAWFAAVPVRLHTIHGWPFHEYQQVWICNFYIRLERWAARLSTCLVAVSAATRRKGLENRIGRPEQYRVIFPASDLKAFAPGKQKQRLQVRKQFGFPAKALLVGMVACLKPQKAPGDFVRAADLVIQTLPQTCFLLVGDGPQRLSIEKEIERLGLKTKLRLAGWQMDIPRLMGAFDLLALSSLWEGLPCVFAQAMASGIPIVATDVEGAREAIIPNQTGLLVPPRNPKALAEGILCLLQSPSQRKIIGKKALAFAQKFGLEVMLQKLDKLYQTLIQLTPS